MNIEHLIVYIPYGLECSYFVQTPVAKRRRTAELTGVLKRGDTWVARLTNSDGHRILKNIETLIPELRPMSELTREELYKHWDDHVDYLTTEREYWIKCSGREYWINEIPHSHYMYLIKNKFDIYGLLEQEVKK